MSLARNIATPRSAALNARKAANALIQAVFVLTEDTPSMTTLEHVRVRFSGGSSQFLEYDMELTEAQRLRADFLAGTDTGEYHVISAEPQTILLRLERLILVEIIPMQLSTDESPEIAPY